MKRILLPIDASSNSLKAVQHVMGRFVTDPDMELHLLHVCTPFSRHVARFVSRRNLAGFHRDEAAKAMAAARLMLDARGIDTFYGPSHILRGVNFHVGRGETVSLLGRNGMGKTTLLCALLGIAGTTAGSLRLRGRADRQKISRLEGRPTDQAAIDFVLDGDIELRAAEAEIVDAEDWCIGFLQAVALDTAAWEAHWDADLLAPLAGLRPPASDKRSHGHLLVLGGSQSYPGAVLMTVLAALRSGVGLVTAFVPESLVPALERLAQNLYICPSTVAQHAALACFEPDSLRLFEQRRAEFQSRRDAFIPALRSIGLDVPVMPDGAFYAWADCSRACERLGVRFLRGTQVCNAQSNRCTATLLLQAEGEAPVPAQFDAVVVCAGVWGRALAAQLGKPVIIENRGGAGGVIGVTAAVNAAPNGSTLLLTTSSLVITAGITPNLAYDPRRDPRGDGRAGQYLAIDRDGQRRDGVDLDFPAPEFAHLFAAIVAAQDAGCPVDDQAAFHMTRLNPCQTPQARLSGSHQRRPRAMRTCRLGDRLTVGPRTLTPLV